MKVRVEELSLFDCSKMGDQDPRRRDSVPVLPPLVEEAEEPAPPAPRRTLSFISLRVLAILVQFPLQVVTIVEDIVGWPEINFGAGGGVIPLNRMDQSRELVRLVPRLVRALRDISRGAWTGDVLHVMQNLEEFFRGMRAPATPLRPGPSLEDLARVAQALEALATGLAGNVNSLAINIVDQDEHIPTLRQLIRFLN
jgi:hypothetical protein